MNTKPSKTGHSKSERQQKTQFKAEMTLLCNQPVRRAKTTAVSTTRGGGFFFFPFVVVT